MQSTSPCRFLETLPADIRNIIYNFVFHEQDGIHIDFSKEEIKTMPSSIFSLPQTCRQIRNECLGLPFWLNTFHFHVPVLKDLANIRATSCAPLILPLPRRDASPRRPLSHKASGASLSSKTAATREKAQQFVTMAMRLPQVDEVLERLDHILQNPDVRPKLRKVHVHLGEQINSAFVVRFFTAWAQIVPYLLALRENVDLRVSFGLRISRRLVVNYDFGLEDMETMLADMDRCIQFDDDLTLPELSMINSVRSRVVEALFVCPDLPLPFSSTGSCASEVLHSGALSEQRISHVLF